MPPRILKLLLPLAAAGSLSACTGFYDDYGYGYGGVSVGYSSGYSSGYGRGYYDDDYYGYYASRPYWGWYNNYYYPGTGYYVYDRYQRRYPWNSYQQRYWTDRQNYWRGRGDVREDRRELRENWREFRQDGQVKYADGTPATISQMAQDVTAFLTWAAEPNLERRHSMGLAVLIFLLAATALAYLAYRNVWASRKVKKNKRVA